VSPASIASCRPAGQSIAAYTWSVLARATPRSAGVPGEHPDRDRAALGVSEQPVLDLDRALLAANGNQLAHLAKRSGA
jgi:hypothetical protein